MKYLNKYVLRFYLKHLLRRYKYLIFINYVNNKNCTRLKSRSLQLDNTVSEVFSASIVKSVFSGCNLSFLKSKLLVIATNDFDMVDKIINFDLGSDFLFFCLNGVFLNSDILNLKELHLLYNNNLFFINFYVVYYYIYLVLVIYTLIYIFLELLNVLNLKLYGVLKLSL